MVEDSGGVVWPMCSHFVRSPHGHLLCHVRTTGNTSDIPWFDESMLLAFNVPTAVSTAGISLFGHSTFPKFSR